MPWKGDTIFQGAMDITGNLNVGGAFALTGSADVDGTLACDDTLTIDSGKISFGAAAPAAGTWAQGDIRINTGAASGTTKVGWICITAGAPGTWKAFGDVAA